MGFPKMGRKSTIASFFQGSFVFTKTQRNRLTIGPLVFRIEEKFFNSSNSSLKDSSLILSLFAS